MMGLPAPAALPALSACRLAGKNCAFCAFWADRQPAYSHRHAHPSSVPALQPMWARKIEAFLPFTLHTWLRGRQTASASSSS